MQFFSKYPLHNCKRADILNPDVKRESYSHKQKEFKMDHKFYDVKEKKAVTAAITEFVTYGKDGRTRYAFRGKTADGRNLTAFVSKEKWEAAQK